MKYQFCLISHHNLPKKSPLEKLGSIHLLAPANFWKADEPTRRYVIPIAELRALAKTSGNGEKIDFQYRPGTFDAATPRGCRDPLAG